MIRRILTFGAPEGSDYSIFAFPIVFCLSSATSYWVLSISPIYGVQADVNNILGFQAKLLLLVIFYCFWLTLLIATWFKWLHVILLVFDWFANHD